MKKSPVDRVQSSGKPKAWAVLALAVHCQLSVVGVCFAGEKGSAAAAFLKMGAGARAASLGEAYTALADDASAVYWNPAALTRVERRSAVLMHTAHVESIAYDFGAVARRLGKTAAAGLAVQHQTAGDIVERDATGYSPGTLKPKDLAVSAAFARQFRGFSAGVAAKYVSSTLKDSAKTAALDVGLLSRPLLNNRVRLGLAAVNLGGKLEYEKTGDDLPSSLRAGAALFLPKGWTGAVDVSLPKDNDPVFGLGAEFATKAGKDWTLAARAGYNSRAAGDSASGASLGLGFGLKSVGVDYGLVPFGDLGVAHRVSLSYKF